MMRSIVLLLVSVASLGTVACDGERLTGSEAQAAFAEVSRRAPTLPAGAMVFVDGVALPEGQPLELEPSDIASIEVVKGAAAQAMYGDAAARGVIHIITKRGADSTAQLRVP